MRYRIELFIELFELCRLRLWVSEHVSKFRECIPVPFGHFQVSYLPINWLRLSRTGSSVCQLAWRNFWIWQFYKLKVAYWNWAGFHYVPPFSMPPIALCSYLCRLVTTVNWWHVILIWRNAWFLNLCFDIYSLIAFVSSPFSVEKRSRLVTRFHCVYW